MADAPRVSWLAAAFAAIAAVLLALAAPDPGRPGDAAMAQRIEAVARGIPDASGRVRPLLIHDDGERWYQPLAVYPAALLLQAGIPGRYAMRLPNAIAAGSIVLLVYALALACWRERRTALVAAALVVAMPAVLMFARSTGAALLLPALAAGSLLAMLAWRRQRRWWQAALAGLALGLMSWTQPSGVVAVPLFFLVLAVSIGPAPGARRALALAALAATMPLAVMAVWLAQHPEAYIDTFGRWAIHPAHVRNPLDGLRAAMRWDVLARRVGDFWAYASPTFLFGGEALFSAAIAIPLVLGIRAGDAPLSAPARTDAQTRPTAALIGALLASLAAAVLLDVPRDAVHVLTLAPFAALLAARGIAALLARRRLAVLGWLFLLLALAHGAARVAQAAPAERTRATYTRAGR